ncbi:MAG: mannose-1-phosphate guanylyltransferase [Anaerolineaceae bacterium]|nr:mannose-1-phosphate guanylyltransferase [Anaerolineaceae bacterium]
MDYALIMAGGAGTRLWPISRERLPKPALQLYADKSMFQIAVERLAPLFDPAHILVVAGPLHIPVLAEQVPEIPSENFIVEPQGRGTAPAIGLAAIHLAQRDPNAAMAVLTADHHIGNTQVFRQVIAAALKLARQEDCLVTLGITPTSPSTQFGYIQQGQPMGCFGSFESYRVNHFVEKPPLETAQKMLAEGGYVWNSGMFIWKVSTILAQFAELMPDLHRDLMRIDYALKQSEQGSGQGGPSQKAYEQLMAELWPGIPKQTIDYGIMERAKHVGVIPVQIEWVDIGSWDNLMGLLPLDENGNATRGQAMLLDSHGSLVMCHNKLVVGIGLEDLIVVDTPDAILVCRRDKVSQVKGMVETLKARGRADLT